MYETKMISKLFILFLVNIVLSDKSCYFNAECPYLLHSTKTPYDTIRGDVRDYAITENCEAVSIWSLHRHGNRNPGGSTTEAMQVVAQLKNDIIASYDAGTSQLCAQDIDMFRKWTWNETLEVSQSYLTGTGYEELYDIATRLRLKYPHLLQGSEDEYYFRPTNEQRTITSAIAFVHGLTDGTNMSLPIDPPRSRDDIVRPYENCDRYQLDVKSSQKLQDQMDAYYSTAQYIAVQNAVQQRIGISTQLSTDDIYSFFELCRFYRSWSENLQSPWCSVFTNEDLAVMEYYDDVRHYYRNGYGSWVNVNLGAFPLKDMYENLEAAVQGRGKKFVSYFTHDTMLEMAFCAMGIFKDPIPLQGSSWDPNRLWRTSTISAFSINIISVLNSCQESGSEVYRVQLFINEKETPVCPVEGCTWQQFQDIFQKFTNATLDFCDMSYVVPEPDTPVPGSAVTATGVLTWVLLMQVVLLNVLKL